MLLACQLAVFFNWRHFETGGHPLPIKAGSASQSAAFAYRLVPVAPAVRLGVAAMASGPAGTVRQEFSFQYAVYIPNLR
jgi:hypothetical protein